MAKQLTYLLIFLLTSSWCGARQADAKSEKIILGYLESAFVGKSELMMNAKLDSGADTSSVYAQDVTFETSKNGEEWVRFRLIGDDGRTVKYKKRVLRRTQIKLKTGGTIERPVVSLKLCVDGVHADAVVNLADRSEFDTPLLIGREFLASRILIDPSVSHTRKSSCKSPSKQARK